MIGHGHGSKLGISHADELRPCADVDAVKIGIGGKKERFGPHHMAVGHDLPASVIMCDTGHLRRFVERCASTDCGCRQAARIGERLNGAGPWIEERSMESIATGAPCGFGCIEQPERRTELETLTVPLLQITEAGARMG